MLAESAFRFGGVEVVLRSDDRRCTDWANSFLPPFFEPVAVDQVAESAAVVTALYREPPQHDRSTEGREQALFLRRSGTRSDGVDSDEIVDRESGDTYRVRDNGVTAHYRSTEPYFLRDPARLVRECAVSRLVDDGVLRVHGAAASISGHGVLVVGKSGGGKSSTLAQLLASGADFIANDRVLVAPDPGGARLLGVPIAIRWSPFQLSTFERGDAFVAGYADHSRFRRSDGLAGFRKYELTPSEVAEVTRREVVPATPLRAVVVADRGRTGPAVLEPVSRDWAVARLSEEILASDPAFPAFFRRSTSDQPRQATAWLADSTSIDWYRLTGSFSDSTAAKRISDNVR